MTKGSRMRTGRRLDAGTKHLVDFHACRRWEGATSYNPFARQPTFAGRELEMSAAFFSLGRGDKIVREPPAALAPPLAVQYPDLQRRPLRQNSPAPRPRLMFQF